MTRLKIFALTAIFLSLVSCLSSTQNFSGLNPEFKGYVPVRTLVWQCQAWPQAAVFSQRQASNAEKTAWDQACVDFNGFVAKGFDGQPYMKGFSYKALESRFITLKKPDFLQQFSKVFIVPTEKLSPKDLQDYYRDVLSPNPAWRAWLNELSLNAAHADALLLPFVVSLAEKKFTDRGLWQAQREGHFVMLLVDLSTARLVWIKEQKTSIKTAEIAAHNITTHLQYREWTELFAKTYAKNFWLDYPGRLD